jgi:heterogeneous nuclear ribonucleoprotein R
MAEGTEAEDQVDFDDNYAEEIDDYAEEQIEEERVSGGGGSADDNDDEQQDEEQQDEEQQDEEPKDLISIDNDTDEKEQSPVQDEKRAELLALPPHGSEVFIGALPRDITEVDLTDLCEPFGEIYEIKLVKNKDTGESKGFAFVGFKSKDVAQKAVEELHNKEFKGRTLRCSISETKYRLFIGNVPKNLTDDEFSKFIEEVGPGAEVIELIKDPTNPSNNRGFAFIEYCNNACADYSRQILSSPNFKLLGNTPTVTWADPKINHDHSAASQVKALYVKNIPENTPSEQLKELFQRHGEVTKVVLPPAKPGGKRDFGFIHFAERSSALKAVKDSEKYEVDGQVLEVVLAKPQNDRKLEANPYNTGAHPNFVPYPGYGATFAGNPYAPVAAPYGGAAAFQQPMIYGRGPMPSGMQMVPMVLPDGRIGYVLQQPGVQMAPAVRPRTGGGRRGGDDSSRGGRRYRPY